MAKTPITDEQRRQWSNSVQIAFLEAIATQTNLNIKDISFQGGTSLSLGWGSPRYSEDLDFLLSNKAIEELTSSMPKIARKIDQILKEVDPLFKLSVKSKERNGMFVFDFNVTHPDFIGKSLIKTEFWTVDKEYLSKYDSEFRVPQHQASLGDVMATVNPTFPVPTSTLESVLADKIVALAYRERLKWRDVFDVWWISQKLDRGLNELSTEVITAKALHHETAYKGAGLLDGIERFEKERKPQLMSKEGCDLDRWLPGSMSSFLEDNIDNMVEKTIDLMSKVKTELEARKEQDKEQELER